MPQSLANILVHIVFSTKNREFLIRQGLEDDLWRYVATICTNQGCHAHKICGIEDHIHIACNLSRTLSVSKLVEEVKTESSKWMKTKGAPTFAWQNGYGAFSVSPSQMGDLIRYIANQREHHRTMTFKEEYLEILKRYGVPYDERYVWD